MTHPFIAAFVIAIVLTSGYGLLEWLLWPPRNTKSPDIRAKKGHHDH